MNKSNKIEQQFFKLLRGGLWETDVRLVSINEGDFAEIKRQQRCGTGFAP